MLMVCMRSYGHVNGFWYLSLHTAVAIGCGAWIGTLAVCFCQQHSTLPVTGSLSDLLVLDMEVIYTYIMAMCAVNIVLYLLVWLTVRFGAAATG